MSDARKNIFPGWRGCWWPREKKKSGRKRTVVAVRNDDPPGWKRRDERFREPRRAKFRNTAATIATRNSPRSPFSPKWMSPWLVFMAGWLCLMYYSLRFLLGAHFVDSKHHSVFKKSIFQRVGKNRFWRLIFRNGNDIDDDRGGKERERKRSRERLEWIVLELVDKFKLSCFNPTVNLAVSNSKVKQLH